MSAMSQHIQATILLVKTPTFMLAMISACALYTNSYLMVADCMHSSLCGCNEMDMERKLLLFHILGFPLVPLEGIQGATWNSAMLNVSMGSMSKTSVRLINYPHVHLFEPLPINKKPHWHFLALGILPLWSILLKTRIHQMFCMSFVITQGREDTTIEAPQ